uniref:Uncharacterized protein n=1 Tax=Cucumis melo TaxID=3656 RepID=A0A9I9EAD4_CUCME
GRPRSPDKPCTFAFRTPKEDKKSNSSPETESHCRQAKFYGLCERRRWGRRFRREPQQWRRRSSRWCRRRRRLQRRRPRWKFSCDCGCFGGGIGSTVLLGGWRAEKGQWRAIV